MEHTKIKCIIMIISHRLHHHHQQISCDNWTKGLTWFCPTCSAPVRTSTLKGQKWDQTIDNTDIVSKKHRCYIGKFPCVLIIQKKPELLQKNILQIYFSFIFITTFYREGRCCNPCVFWLWRYTCRYSCRSCTDMLHYFMPYFFCYWQGWKLHHTISSISHILQDYC